MTVQIYWRQLDSADLFLVAAKRNIRILKRMCTSYVKVYFMTLALSSKLVFMRGVLQNMYKRKHLKKLKLEQHKIKLHYLQW